MLFKLFRIRKLIKEGKKNPGGLARAETRGALSALLILPGISIVLWLALMFILGFTQLLGGPWGFFKFVFAVSLIGTLMLGILLHKLLRFAGRAAQKKTEELLQQSATNTMYTAKEK